MRYINRERLIHVPLLEYTHDPREKYSAKFWQPCSRPKYCLHMSYKQVTNLEKMCRKNYQISFSFRRCTKVIPILGSLLAIIRDTIKLSSWSHILAETTEVVEVVDLSSLVVSLVEDVSLSNKRWSNNFFPLKKIPTIKPNKCSSYH